MKKVYTFATCTFILLFFIQSARAQDVGPFLSNRFSLGSPTVYWKALYVNNISAYGNVSITGGLAVAGTTVLNSLQINGAPTFSSLGAGILTSNASGVISSGPLSSSQIPLLPYLQLVGGSLTGTLNGTTANFTGLLSGATDATFGGNLTLGNDAAIGGNMTTKGNTTINGNTAIGGTIKVGTNAQIGGGLMVGGAVAFLGTLTGTTANFTGLLSGATDATFGGNLTLGNDATIGGNIRITKDAGILGNASVSGNATIIGNTTITGNTAIGATIKVGTDAQIGGSLAVGGTVTFLGPLTGTTANFTSSITGPTVAPGDNSNNLATTAFVDAAIAASPTLSYLPLSGGTLTGNLNGTSANFSGNVTGVTAPSGDISTKLATTAFVSNAIGAQPGNSGNFPEIVTSLGLTTNGNANINGTLGLTGPLTGTTATFTESVTSLGLTTNGNANINGTLGLGGQLTATTASFSGPVTIGGLPVAGATSPNGSLVVTGPFTGTTGTFTGTVTGVTPVAGDNSNNFATTAFVGSSISAIQLSSGGWGLSGNSGTVDGTNFIGTTDNAPLNFRINNTAAGRIDLTNNTFFGYTSGGYTGSYNTAIGARAMIYNNGGTYNTAIGAAALYANFNGLGNIAVGYNALDGNTSGNENIGVGNSTLQENSTGYNLTAIGNYVDVLMDGFFNSTGIGYGADIDANNEVVLGNNLITAIKAQVSGITMLSDGRFKKNIQENVPGLEFIKLLRPVTYTYDIKGLNAHRLPDNPAANGPKGSSADHQPRADGAPVAEKEKIFYSGLIAQEVEMAAGKINYDFSGLYKPQTNKDTYGLNYVDFVMPLIRATQQLSASNDSMQNQITDLQNQLNELKAQVAAIVSSGNINKESISSTEIQLSSARLEQNAPNPFSQTTIINYYVPQTAGNAMLTVADMTGKSIKTVPLSTMGSGQLTLQTAQLAGGTYTYSLYIDGNLIDTKKMVLVK